MHVALLRMAVGLLAVPLSPSSSPPLSQRPAARCFGVA